MAGLSKLVRPLLPSGRGQEAPTSGQLSRGIYSARPPWAHHGGDRIAAKRMRQRPVWALSAWGGFICMLFALSSLMHGAIAASLLMVFGAAVLVGWAFWLARH
jgi:hypothetical protein